MNRITVLIVMLGLAGSFAQAQTETTTYGETRGAATMDYYPHAQQRGWAGYLGLNAGYTAYNSNLDVEGAPASFKLLASYVTPSAMGVFDAGYGVQGQKFSQDGAKDDTLSTGVMELAARYQFENRWQLGPVYNQFFDKGANYGANQADAQFGGLQLMREFNMGDRTLGRLGARVMTSINVDGESVNMAMIDFQMGWGQMSSTYSTSSSRSY